MPAEVSASYIGVIVILALTRESKNFYVEEESQEGMRGSVHLPHARPEGKIFEAYHFIRGKITLTVVPLPAPSQKILSPAAGAASSTPCARYKPMPKPSTCMARAFSAR